MKIIAWFSAVVLIAAAVIGVDYFLPGKLTVIEIGQKTGGEENLADRVAKARRRSTEVKGVYMTSIVANDRGLAATSLRNGILNIIDSTELNSVVIDVKETEGGLIITDDLRKLIQHLRNKGVWIIARQAVFKDNSQTEAHPEWYLEKKDGKFWRDNRGGLWLDPSSTQVWQYQIGAAKLVADAGFDEIQFDYIRFPSDGDVRNIVYPTYDTKRSKHEVLTEFFSFLHNNLKAHRPELILSADLFGYVALQKEDLGIGQRLQDIGENFDYVSLMVYPSHYYGGFETAADPTRNLAALYYPYRSKNIAEVVAHHPYEVVYRTLIIAEDILAGRAATGTDQSDQSSRLRPGLGENDKTATPTTSSLSSASPPGAPRRARLRPWLQDFDLAVDSAQGIRYDSIKVRAQIDAAEAAGASGWLLWSPTNIYTGAALKSE